MGAAGDSRPGHRAAAGPGQGRGALYIHLDETLVLAWDLAKATGQQLIVDDEVVEASLAQLQETGPRFLGEHSAPSSWSSIRQTWTAVMPSVPGPAFH